MLGRRGALGAMTAAVIGAGGAAGATGAAGAAGATGAARPRRADAEPVTIEELNELGPENGRLARRAGLWDVTETVWASPGAAPVTTTGLVAERVMTGSLLQEFLRPEADRSHRAVARTDLLSFDRIESRWKYVSFDMRAPVGLMQASGSEPGDEFAIALAFEPFTHAVTAGGGLVGEMLLMTQTIRFESPDRDAKDQYVLPSNGQGKRWLAHRYAYVRRA